MRLSCEWDLFDNLSLSGVRIFRFSHNVVFFMGLSSSVTGRLFFFVTESSPYDLEMRSRSDFLIGMVVLSSILCSMMIESSGSAVAITLLYGLYLLSRRFGQYLLLITL